MGNSVTLGSNISALKAQRQLARSANELYRSQGRLASGQRINSASDDAAGLSISMSLNATGRVLRQGIRNLNDGVSLLNIAESSVSSLSDIVIRQLELAEQSANGTFSSVQRAALQKEITALTSEYNRITSTTSFNGLILLNGSVGRINIQDGEKSSSVLGIDILAQSSTKVAAGTYQSVNYYTSDGQGAEGGAAQDRGSIVADVNGDGIDDLIITGEKGNFELFLGSSSGVLSAQGTINAPSVLTYSDGYSSVEYGIADRDGDGKQELYLRIGGISDENGFFDYEYLSYSFSNSSFMGSQSFTPPSGVAFNASGTVGDFNGDGIDDYVIVGDADGPEGNTGFAVFIQDTTSVPANGSLSQSPLDVTSTASAREALQTLNHNLADLTSTRGRIGASLSRMQTSLNATTIRSVEYENANSRIISVDFAEEAAIAVRASILQNVGASVLAQAASAPNLVLTLLR